MMNQNKKTIITILITIACAICGYGFYVMNKHDVINSIAFGLGLTGIMLSFLRNINQPKS